MMKLQIKTSVLLVLFIFASCDPLDEHIVGLSPEVEFISPADETTWHQPGATVSVEIQVTHCEKVEEIIILADNANIIFEERSPVEISKQKYRFEIPVLRLLENLFSEPVQNKAIDLRVRLSCYGYSKPIESPYHRVYLSPFESITEFGCEVFHLHPGPLSERQLTLCEQGLYILSEEGSFSKFNAYNQRGQVRFAQDSVYFWIDCTDPVCINHLGTLYRLGKSNLWPYFDGIEMASMQTNGELVDIVDAADPDRIMLAQKDDPAIWIIDSDFNNAQRVEVDFQPVGPFKCSAAGDCIVLGFPVWYLSANLQIATIGPGPSISQQTIDLELSVNDSQWDLNDDGSRAVVLDLPTGQLHRILTYDGSLLPTISSDLINSQVISIAFAGDDQVLLVARDTIKVYDFESGQEIWALTLEDSVTAAIPRPTGDFVLLTGGLDFWVINNIGQPITKMGGLPSDWYLSSNLVASSDGSVRFALGDRVVSYRTVE
jgi:hypothetical protein